MKIRYKAKYYKKDKETRVNYINMGDPTEFRKTYIKYYLHQYERCVLAINTNIIDEAVSTQDYIKKVESAFKEKNITYKIQLIPNTGERKLLGIPVGTKKDKAYMVLADMTTQEFEMLFDQLLEKVDYMIGFNMDQSFEELVHEFENDYDLFLISHPAFEHTLYDSYLIRSVRTTFKTFPEIEVN